MRENCYGILKRVQFFEKIIGQLKPETVLDIGCGTGAQVTFPLAEKFPWIQFTGADSDSASIELARATYRLPNLNFIDTSAISATKLYDLIIASEVIEHVEKPDEFLRYLRDKLTSSGAVLLTLPNGYGTFEALSLIEATLQITGIYRIIRKIKRMLVGGSAGADTSKCDTIAISPHINFFSFNGLMRLITNAGFIVAEYKPRTFLCGFGVENIMTRKSWLAWNTQIADALPPYAVSGWMFALRTVEQNSSADSYQRCLYERFRRYVNRKRWRMKE